MNKLEWKERLPLLAALNIHTLCRNTDVVQREEVQTAVQDLGLPSVPLPTGRLIEALSTEAALAKAGITVDLIHQKTADYLRSLEQDTAKRNEKRSVLVDRMSKTADPNQVETIREDIMSGNRTRQLSGKELGELAEQMINALTEGEKDAFREKLIRGFYGGEPPKSLPADNSNSSESR